MGQIYTLPNVGELPNEKTSSIALMNNGGLLVFETDIKYYYIGSNVSNINTTFYTADNYLHMYYKSAAGNSIYIGNNRKDDTLLNSFGVITTSSTITDVRVTGISESGLLFNISLYDNSTVAYNVIADTYPITYSSSNSIVSGPSEAVVGSTVIVSATPDVGYGITDASTQILVTNNDVAVPYTWDATNNRITFTMPDPS